MSALDDLLATIFDSQTHMLYPEFADWARDSRRFQDFAHTYRAKIRAKLRNARDESGMQDLRAELATAALLLREKQFTLEYEKYVAARQRGPDFTVTFRGHTPFNVEVRRLYDLESTGSDIKMMSVLCNKVGQMPPSIVNLLWLVADRPVTGDELTEAVTTLRQLAERKEETFFVRGGFESAADFLRRYPRLSGIVVSQITPLVVWLNPDARHKTPSKIAAAVQRLGQ